MLLDQLICVDEFTLATDVYAEFLVDELLDGLTIGESE
jgi:hypothetical protein